jgi:hypothetical protein
MDWLILTEYSARFLGAGLAQFECDQPLVEQNLLIDGELTRSRAFSARTNLIHVRADTDCMIEIGQPSVSGDVAAGGQQFFAVLPGSQLTVMKAMLCPIPTENLVQETPK